MLTDEQSEAVAQLVDQYERLSDAERRRYSETDTRTNFIDRLFLALGWPVYDREHVERETTVAEGKRPDYIFKLHGVPRLFLEAKPLRDDAYNLEYARDAITKAYNKGVPWAGVTNFTHLVIFDAQEELATGAQPRRVLDLTHADYLRPDGGLHFLTLQALDERLLDEQAQRTGVRRRPVPIEKRLYESMRAWRESLFNAMSGVHQWRTDQQLRDGDEAIQRLIDRLIFLRNCEDRGIGPTDLRALLNRIRSHDRNVRVTDSLLRLFADAARTYDSELFKTDALIDLLLRPLGTILDDTLAGIIEGLYSVPRSYAEYNFAEMQPDVLGQVYEQYLGYVPQRVRQLAAQQPLPAMPAPEIAVEAKRQRRKEHGIYYTPTWVVHYIVQQTLGRFLEENRNNEDAIANLTVLDLACGSGSFLIHAYETLLQHHAARMGGDIGHLDTRTREHILRHNIFGVDIDPQAVEIARLNLLIRMVRQQELLPPLAENIRLGNSLISGTEDELRSYFGDAWKDKRPFDWPHEFPEIMARGGFDIIIGNPPYVRPHKLDTPTKTYLWQHFTTYRAKSDIYHCFIEQALRLTRTGGILSFITGDNWRVLQSAQPLRSLVLGRSRILQLATLPPRVFQEAAIQTLVSVLQKIDHEEPPTTHLVEVVSLPDRRARHIPQDLFANGPGQILDLMLGQEVGLADKIEQAGEPLSNLVTVDFGLKTGDDATFIRPTSTSPEDRPLVRGGAVDRYSLRCPHEYVWYVPQQMRRHRKTARPGEPERFERPKILIRDTSYTIRATYDAANLYAKDVLILHTPRHPYSLKYILAILNSSLMAFLYNGRYTSIHVNRNEVLKLPVRPIDFDDAAAKATHDRLVALAERMLDLHQRLAAKGDVHDNEREQIERDITRTDREIDDLVYDLYGLTPEERALIEAEIRR